MGGTAGILGVIDLKVVVVGGGGYLGRPLAGLLRGHADTVSASQHRGEDVDEQLDLRRPEEIYRLLGRVRPDVVVLTAYLLERATAADPMRAVETNILGVTNVFQAAVDLGLRRVVFASSGAVHGSTEDFQARAFDELTPCRPTTLYGRMKAFNESIAEHYNARFGTEIVSYRISGPYGRGKSYERFGGEIPYDTVVAAARDKLRHEASDKAGDQARAKARIVLPWSAAARFRFIHVDDAAASFLPLVLTDRLKHRVYNAPGFTVSVRQLAEAAKSIGDLDCSFTEPGRPVKLVRWDSTRYEEEFGFRPLPMSNWMQQEVNA
jgi:nucleoside-diphosphate-sugar epimerase